MSPRLARMGPKIGFMHLKAPFLILLGAHSMLVGLGCAQQSELTLADPHTFPSHGEGFASFIDTASVVSSKGWQRFGEMLSTTQAEHAQRGLQQVGEVTVVTTAEALQQAVLVGKEHIEIQAHLDLTELDYPAEAWNGLLGSIPTTVKSIRGNCGSVLPPAPRLPAGHAPMRDFLPSQCLLLVDTALLYVDKTRNLWLDNLYVRLKDVRDEEGMFGQIIGIGRSKVEVWMTNLTLQGNGDGIQDCSYCGIYIWWTAGGYCEGCTFADFDGHQVVRARNQASLYLLNSEFDGNTLFPGDKGAAVIMADADGSSKVSVKLQGVSFRQTSPISFPNLLADNRDDHGEAVFYSNSSIPQVCVYEGSEEETPSCRFESAQSLTSASPDFISASSNFLVLTQQELDNFDRTTYSAKTDQIVGQDTISAQPEAEATSPPPSSAKLPVAIIMGATLAGLAVLGAAIISMVIVYRRRAAADTNQHSPSSKVPSSKAASSKEALQHTPPSAVWKPPPTAMTVIVSGGAMARGGVGSGASDSYVMRSNAFGTLDTLHASGLRASLDQNRHSFR